MNPWDLIGWVLVAAITIILALLIVLLIGGAIAGIVSNYRRDRRNRRMSDVTNQHTIQIYRGKDES